MKTKIVMLLSNPYNPDDRVRSEALALQEMGYEVIILAWDRDCTRPVRERVDGLEVRRSMRRAGYEQGGKQGLHFLRLWCWFLQEIKQLQPQVVHCHDYDTFLAGVWYLLLDRRVKVVLDAHENYYMMMKPLVSGFIAWTISVLELLFTRCADLLISSCEATANHYSHLGARKVVVVGNWKTPKNYQFSSDALSRKRKELGIGEHLVVAYIGLLSAKRNVMPLLQAIRKRPWVFLILGGRGDQENAIRDFCSGLENIYFPGYISPDDVPFLTAVADVIYYGLDPGHVYAPFNAPNKLYEALAAGKAILAAELGGELSSIVRSTQCGLLVSRVDAESIGVAIDMLAQESVRYGMQERAKQAGLTTYNWIIAKQILQTAYSNLLVEARNNAR